MARDDAETIDGKKATSAPRDRAWLVVSAQAGVACVPLVDKAAFTLGRSPESDVPIDDESVSREHALLRATSEGTFTIEDRGSRNGTFVSGRKLGEREQAPLAVGVVVQVGSATVLLASAQAAILPSVRDPSTTGEVAGAEPIVLDPAMQRLYALLDLIAPSPLAVLVLGETGTGKEVFAAEIHARSKRASKPFLKLNCATLSGSLLESELFGHEKGAFTGAVTAKAGLFEAANGGTLFLDEIGELPPDTQAKLLRVLDTGEVLRLGSVTPRKVDVRYVAATNRDLHREVADGRFRSDLLFRLNGFEVTLPPLRKRHAEVLALAVVFVERAAKQAKVKVPTLTDATRTALTSHGWPGNVRELKTTMERACALAAKRGRIDPADLMLRAAPVAREDGLNEVLAAREKERVLEALERANGNQTAAAKLLGVSRRTIVTKIEKYGIDRPRKR